MQHRNSASRDVGCTPLSRGVFISYRRGDTAGHAGRLEDALTSWRVGHTPWSVFRDVRSIQPGSDFERVIERGVLESDVMLVLIGPRWAGLRGRRIAEEGDLVRQEVALGLARGIPIVPTLVGGARMPSPSRLPRDIVALCRRQAVRLTDDNWSMDVERLCRILAQVADPSVTKLDSRGYLASATPCLLEEHQISEVLDLVRYYLHDWWDRDRLAVAPLLTVAPSDQSQARRVWRSMIRDATPELLATCLRHVHRLEDADQNRHNVTTWLNVLGRESQRRQVGERDDQ